MMSNRIALEWFSRRSMIRDPLRDKGSGHYFVKRGSFEALPGRVAARGLYQGLYRTPSPLG